LDNFPQWYKEQTGEEVKLILESFDMEEIVITKVAQGREDFDLVCCPEGIVNKLLVKNLLFPIEKDFGAIPNYISNLSPFIQQQLNKLSCEERKMTDYSVGYMWGTVGVLYNADMVEDKDVLSWDLLWKERYRNSILMKDVCSDIYGVVIGNYYYDDIVAGKMDATELILRKTPEDIALVEKLLKEMKPNIVGWEIDFGREIMTKGKIPLNVTYSGDAMWAIKTLVFDEHKYTLEFYKEALENNYGEDMHDRHAEKLTLQVVKELTKQGKNVSEQDIVTIYNEIAINKCSKEKKAQYQKLKEDIEALPKFGNDIEEIDNFARHVTYLYTKPMDQYKNPRGGIFQAGLYPVSANVLLGGQTGPTPDARIGFTPVADGVSPAAGRDVKGPTASCNSVSHLDHFIASNGTLFNMKFHPTALAGVEGLENFISLVRGYFDRKGTHMQFNVVSRETLRDAQKHPDKYRSLVVRVAGYSALFTTLSRALQDDIIKRTEQGEF